MTRNPLWWNQNFFWRNINETDQNITIKMISEKSKAYNRIRTQNNDYYLAETLFGGPRTPFGGTPMGLLKMYP